MSVHNENPVKIIRSRHLSDLEVLLNKAFKEGYHISGGITVRGDQVVVVVVKPF